MVEMQDKKEYKHLIKKLKSCDLTNVVGLGKGVTNE